MSAVPWDRNTRLLHFGLVLSITFELFSGLFVSDPNTRLYFRMHEIGGLTAAGFVLLHWMWSFARQDLAILFPWNAQGLARSRDELIGMLRGRLPQQGHTVGLSGFVHGLGLLAASGMALSGVFIFLIIPGGLGASSASTNYALFTGLSVLHRFLSSFLWAYLGGHVVFAILHQVQGHPVFGAIFAGRTELESAE